MVSIHAPLTGGDMQEYAPDMSIWTVSIHAPLTGGDTPGRIRTDRAQQFQSTPPSQEATGQ